MSDLRDESDNGIESVVYRSKGVALFDEDAQPWTPRKRTRVSARFDRTHWEPEYFHPFIERDNAQGENRNTAFAEGPAATAVFLAAMRRSNVSRTTKKKLPPTDRRLAEAPGHQHRYTMAELKAVPMHGKYRMLDVIEYGDHGAMKVRAVCEGGWCPGKHRIFGPGEWLDLTEGTSCQKCDSRQKRADLHAQMQRDVHEYHGKYRFLRFDDHGDEDCNFVRRVIGECTGGSCNGSTRGWLFNAWQDGDTGLTGCSHCTRIGRTKRGPTAPLTKLDAAADEMRKLEVAV